MNQFKVAEIFGPTIQGEGSAVGRSAHFIRLGGCDFRCKWCDSLHAVLPEEVKKLPMKSVNGIVDEVNALGFAEIVVISGGNPLLWDLTELVEKLQKNYEVHVETQGSIWKDWLLKVDHVTLSPKPPSAGDEPIGQFFHILRELRMKGALYQSIDLKVVIFDEWDLEYAMDNAEIAGVKHLHLSVGTVMDEPLEATLERFRILIPLVNEYKDRQFTVSLQPQMHVILWGHSLGV